MAGVSAEVELPSGSLVAKKVKIRSMLGKDERLIAEINSQNYERKTAELLKALTEGVDVMNLTEKDELYLLLWVAVNSYSSSFPIEAQCEHCFANFKQDVNLAKFPVKTLTEGFVEPVKVKLSTGDEVGVRLSRVRDVISVSDFERAHTGDSAWLFAHAVTIENGKTVIENMKMLGDLPAKDLVMIRKVQEEAEHGVKMVAPYKCSVCGGSGEIPVPFRLQMVFPTGARLRSFA